MISSSSMCFGETRHRRFTPKPHQFKYNLIMPLLDLDEIPELETLSRWLRVNRSGGIYSFCEDDYLSDYLKPNESLKQRAVRVLKQHTGEDFSGKVLLLAQWRFLGKVFNPITNLYFLDAQDQLTYMMSEVSNTPWNERHIYWHKLADNQEFHHKTTQKRFHVSPYNPMDMEYEWRFSLTAEKVSLHLSLNREEQKCFDASFLMKREPLNSAAFYKAVKLKPFQSIHAVIGIYWEALKLFVKRIPIYDHRPKKQQENSKWQKQN